MTEEELRNIFTFHSVKGDQADRYPKIRQAGLDLALVILDNCPDSRERSTAFTRIQEAIMFANAAIAVHE
jgi:hypothetical protein